MNDIKIRELNAEAQQVMDSLTKEDLITWLEENSIRRFPAYGYLAARGCFVIDMCLVAIDVEPEHGIFGRGYASPPEWLYQFHAKTNRHITKQDALAVAKEV